MGEWIINVEEAEIPIHDDELKSWLKGLVAGSKYLGMDAPYHIQGVSRYSDHINFKCNGTDIQVRIRGADA